ncbi:MAG TPA: tyrosine-type recombinase/integrase [Solirubrobacteraceae bacterium]|nr:tyrosine-type recombinase/integrase [Solirubrobacteraceae bacterium]
MAEARGWKASAEIALRNGTFSSGAKLTLREAATDWLAMAESGQALNRSGKRYKPSVIRSYETSLRLHVLPIIGSMKLINVRRRDVQELVDRIALDRNPSTVRNAIMPVRAIYRRAFMRDVVQVNPTESVALPAVEGVRDRIASPEEAAELIGALPVEDRAVWATAMYAGLRLGELQALGWENIDLDGDLIRVEWSWDKKAGRVLPKSRAGKRSVPIPKILHDHLTTHCERAAEQAGLVFGRSPMQPFSDGTLRSRATRIWTQADMAPIGFHEGRHTYASLMIAAGVNAKALATFMGHRSITTTLDRYGHLFPGSEGEAAALLDAYLEGE